jgi:DNA-binding response OmpR family regulator
VISAENGPACLELARQCNPDLVLLDVLMPGMSGWEVARALRRSGHEKTRILMLSANASENHATLSPDRAHDDYMMKPVDIRQLLDKIHALLNVEWTYDLPEEAPGSTP